MYVFKMGTAHRMAGCWNAWACPKGEEMLLPNLKAHHLAIMPYIVMCAVLGHRTPFSINIESDMRVSERVLQIKINQPRMLASFDNTNLIFYKVDLPDDEAVLEAQYGRALQLFFATMSQISSRISAFG